MHSCWAHLLNALPSHSHAILSNLGHVLHRLLPPKKPIVYTSDHDLMIASYP